jgi:hypothetical protein
VERGRTPEKLTLQIPEGVEYRPLSQDGEVPERFSAVCHLPASGVGELRLDLIWNDSAGQFDVVSVTMTARKGGSITNLEGIRTAYVRAWREASRRVVRARMDAVDGKGASTLERAASIYRLAKAAGESPTKAVAEQLGISRDAAAQQVHRARQTGLLPKVRLVRLPVEGQKRPKKPEGRD